MKKLLIICSLFTAPAFAANLNLNVGESAIVTANVNTTVTCGNDSSTKCDAAIAALSKSLTYCYKDKRGSECVGTHWPRFRDQNPTCVNAATDMCLEYCFKDQTGSWCANYCR